MFREDGQRCPLIAHRWTVCSCDQNLALPLGKGLGGGGSHVQALKFTSSVNAPLCASVPVWELKVEGEKLPPHSVAGTYK